VRMIDNTTEITIEARQPMRETLMLDNFRALQRCRATRDPAPEIHACN
jgi:hypothetical protein